MSLCTYTCAAVPVFDPRTGHLEGSVNLTTWSRSSHDLLLALAQSAAGTTAAMMLPGVSRREAAVELGMSRATIYRKIAQYDLHLPRR